VTTAAQCARILTYLAIHSPDVEQARREIEQANEALLLAWEQEAGANA
jgi:hypothetical protein